MFNRINFGSDGIPDFMRSNLLKWESYLRGMEPVTLVDDLDLQAMYTCCVRGVAGLRHSMVSTSQRNG
jgi:hypothetical protein